MVNEDDQFGGDSEEEIEAEITPTSGLNNDEDQQVIFLVISNKIGKNVGNISSVGTSFQNRWLVWC